MAGKTVKLYGIKGKLDGRGFVAMEAGADRARTVLYGEEFEVFEKDAKDYIAYRNASYDRPKDAPKKEVIK